MVSEDGEVVLCGWVDACSSCGWGWTRKCNEHQAKALRVKSRARGVRVIQTASADVEGWKLFVSQQKLC
jgi:hypothetical protein